MEHIQSYLEFVGVFIGTVLLISTFTPKGYHAVRFAVHWFKRTTLDDIYDRLDAIEVKIGIS